MEPATPGGLLRGQDYMAMLLAGRHALHRRVGRVDFIEHIDSAQTASGAG
jgi:hypothetical protein